MQGVIFKTPFQKDVIKRLLFGNLFPIEMNSSKLKYLDNHYCNNENIEKYKYIHLIFVLKPIVDALEWGATVVAKSCQSSILTSLPQKHLALVFHKIVAVILGFSR